MNRSVLKRKMFMKPPVKMAHGGILNFLAMEMDGNGMDNFENRKPSNPEIVANNIRGDIRSLDERYEELSELLGKESASQIPEEALVLMQKSLGQQDPQQEKPVQAAAQGGIQGLLQSFMAPPQEQPPQGMPQGMPPPVNRANGSPPMGEGLYDPSKGFGRLPGGGLRIDVSGVQDPNRDEQMSTPLIPQNINAPIRIPTVQAQTPNYGLSFGTPGSTGFQPSGPTALDVYNQEQAMMNQPTGPTALDVYNQEQGMYQLPDISPVNMFGNEVSGTGITPEILSQDIDDYGANGGSLPKLIDAISGSEEEFKDKLNKIATGEFNLGEDNIGGTAEFDLANNVLPEGATPGVSSPAQVGGKKPSFDISKLGALASSLMKGGVGGADKGQIGATLPEYVGFPLATSQLEEDPLTNFSSLKDKPDTTQESEGIGGLIPQTPSVFKVDTPQIQVGQLEPVKRAKGSLPSGERKEPNMGGILDYINDPETAIGSNEPGMSQPKSRIRPNMPKLERDLINQGILDDTVDNEPKSRSLTEKEMFDRVNRREGTTNRPFFRAFMDTLRNMGIDPKVAANRLNSVMDTLKKIPGAGKIFKYADVALAGGALALGYNAKQDNETPSAPIENEVPGGPPPKIDLNEGVVPRLPQTDTGAGADGSGGGLIPPSPPSNVPLTPETIPPRQGVTVQATPFSALGPTTKEEEALAALADRPNVITGENVPIGDQPEGEDTLTALAASPKQPGESDSDYEARVRSKMDAMMKFLGRDPKEKESSAWFLLAEAGLAMAGAKGSSIGERVAKGLRGLPSGLAKLNREDEALRRQVALYAVQSVDQEDRDRRNAAYELSKALMTKASTQSAMDLQGFIADIARKYNLPEDDPRVIAEAKQWQLSKGKTRETDEFGNVRGLTGDILIYGHQGATPGSKGYIETERGNLANPFLVKNPARFATVKDKKGIEKVLDTRRELETNVNQMDTLATNLAEVFGFGNAFTRALSKGTVPLFGDLGPLNVDAAESDRAIKLLNKELQRILSTNDGRVSNLDLTEVRDLLAQPGFLSTPEGAFRFYAMLRNKFKNHLNLLDNSLNPNIPLNQEDLGPSGTKAQPFTSPQQLLWRGKDFFDSIPNGTLYIKRGDKVMGVNKETFYKNFAQ